MDKRFCVLNTLFLIQLMKNLYSNFVQVFMRSVIYREELKLLTWLKTHSGLINAYANNDQTTMCYVKKVAHRDEPAGIYHQTVKFLLWIRRPSYHLVAH